MTKLDTAIVEAVIHDYGHGRAEILAQMSDPVLASGEGIDDGNGLALAGQGENSLGSISSRSSSKARQNIPAKAVGSVIFTMQ